ncbi:hypothetical protein Tco_0528641 [Tanacetum coccineum]
MINGEVQLHALVDGKKIIVTEASVRSDLQLDDEEDEAIYKELDDSLVRAATTSSSLEEEQDSGNITKTRSKATPNKAGFQGTTSGGGPRCQETMKLNELMELCTNLQTRVLDLEKTKTTQGNEIASLKRRVKKLEKRNRLCNHKLKRLYKVGLTARVESSGDKESLGEDASKQGRISDIDVDEDITLVNVHADEEMFDINDLGGEEVFVAEQNEEVVDAAQVKTTTITTEEVTLAQALASLKTSKPKMKELLYKSQDKGKGIMVEPEKPMKKKDQISFDEETAKRVQAEFDKEERLAREKAQKEQEANIALTEERDDI